MQVLLCLRGGGLSLQRDDQVNGGEPCDNISAKNGSYCELTAMYWAWKNIKKIYPNLEYIGLNHYRRYFSFDEKKYLSHLICKSLCEVKNYKYRAQKVYSLLQKDFSIVSKVGINLYTYWITYCCELNSSDFLTVRRVIHEFYPEYDEAFYTVEMRGNACSPYNMFIMKWEDFDNYCSWLFKILFETEKRIDISYYKGHYKRTFGYIGEKLLSVWLYQNRIKTKKVNVYYYTDYSKVKNRPVRRCIQLMRCFIGSRMMRPWHKHISNWKWLDENS